MKYCSKCGFEMDDDMKFCPKCGFSQNGIAGSDFNLSHYCGIMAVVFCCLCLIPVSLIMSVIGYVTAKSKQDKKLNLIMLIISLVITCIALFIVIYFIIKYSM